MKTPNRYQIQVQGHVDPALAEWFAPLSVANQANGEATLSGPIRDQAELFGILLRLYNLNFTLIAVQRMQASAGQNNVPGDADPGCVVIPCSISHSTKGENHERH